MASRLASTCPFTETTHGDCVFAFPKHISLISLQGRFLGFARNDDTSGTQFHILASPFPNGEGSEMRMPLCIPNHTFLKPMSDS